MKRHYTSLLLVVALATQPVAMANPIVPMVAYGAGALVRAMKSRFIQRIGFGQRFPGYEGLEPAPSLEADQKPVGLIGKGRKITKELGKDLGITKGDGEYKKRAKRRWQARAVSTMVLTSTLLNAAVAGVFYVPMMSHAIWAGLLVELVTGLSLANRLHKEANGKEVVPNAHLETLATAEFTNLVLSLVCSGLIGVGVYSAYQVGANGLSAMGILV